MVDVVGSDWPNLLVFDVDWGRHPTSCQHLILRLLPRHRAAWVQTIGMRRPSFDLTTLTRASGKIRSWLLPGKQKSPLPENLSLLNPWMWPWFTTARARRINRLLLRRQLAGWVEAQRGAVVGISTLPIVADLMDDLPVSRWVYYCVDEFGKWPGLDHVTLDQMESSLIERAEVVIAASETLQNKLLQWRRDVALLTHGVDLKHWTTNSQHSLPAELAGLQRPLAVYWGLIDERMDVRFVERLSQYFGEGTILLVGPLQSPNPELLRLDRVRRVPAVGYDQLPVFGQAADVLIMPYKDAPVTRAMQPLKLLEYLATGKPVVARDLPSTRPWADCLDLATTPEDFSALVGLRLREGLPREQRVARKRIDRESWSNKAQEFERLALDGVRTPSEHR